MDNETLKDSIAALPPTNTVKSKAISDNQALETLRCWRDSLIIANPKELPLIEYIPGNIPPGDELPETSKILISIYEEYLFATPKKIPRLLKKFCSLKDHTERHKEKTVASLCLASQHHLGHTQNTYPLSLSQRISLSYLSDPKSNGIFTIPQPFDHGKTSLLLSIIASKWVEAAIQKKPPPIMVTASANNLARTNILDYLNEISRNNQLFCCARWIPDFNSYGLFLASNHEANQAKERHYFYRLADQGSGSVENFYSEEYRHGAKIYFLEQFNLNYQQSESDLLSCQSFIHKLMLSKQALLNQTLNFVAELNKFQEDIQLQYGDLAAITRLIGKTREEKSKSEETIKNLEKLRDEWFLYKKNELKWPKLFSWLPFVRPMLKDRIKSFTSGHHKILSEKISHIDEIEETLHRKINTQIAHGYKYDALLADLGSIIGIYDTFCQDKTALEQQLGFELFSENLWDTQDQNHALDKLDITLRYDLFILATHYWEISWLLTSETIDSQTQDAESQKKYWHTQAMLTPFFITSLHSGPAFFRYKKCEHEFETFTNLIDLLIIDETEQLIPAIAGALISIAKKLVLIGERRPGGKGNLCVEKEGGSNSHHPKALSVTLSAPLSS